MRSGNIIKILSGIFVAGLLMAGLPACNDYDFAVDESFEQTFRPPLFRAEGIRATTVRLEWEKVRGAENYLLEVSRDSLEFNDPVAYELPYARDSITLTNLYSDNRYSARIKAFSANGLPESEYNIITFVTLGEQIFLVEEIVRGFNDESNTNYLELSWLPGSLVTHIQLNVFGEDPVIITLTEDEIEAGYARLENLKPSTEYVVGIYRDENRRGWYNYSSFDAYPEGFRLVQAGEDLKAILDTSGEEHLILVLEAGALFDVRRPQLSAAIKHLEIWGNPAGERALINTTTFTLNENTELFKLKNLEVFGDSNTADYLMNENKTTNVSEIVIENCYLHTFRGLIRLQNNANNTQIDLVKIDNSVIHNIGGYGIINGGGDGGYRIENILISNSTFSEVISHFMDIRRQGGVYVVENCTFYDAIGTGRALLNTAGEAAHPQHLEVKNCIFGKFYYIGEYSDGESVRGVNPAFPSQFVYDSYALSDFVMNEDFPFNGISIYGKPSDEVFANPEEGDFTIVDNAFPGRINAGDPRWR